VIDFDICTRKGDCLLQCPTGAIDSFRMVTKPWSTADQLSWDSLPQDQELAPQQTSSIPVDIAQMTRTASEGSGGKEIPPFSAPHPYVGLYTPTRPAIATITGNLRLTGEEADVDIRHLVLDFGKTVFPILEGQSIGIQPPGVDETGRAHHVRLYSVASPRGGERPGFNNVALTVKRITEDENGDPVCGVASNYLCDLERGAEVTVTGPFGSTFLMPDDPNARLIMICTGTGSAPFRGMTERRRRKNTPGMAGSMNLFFGARQKDGLPYFGPLMKLPSSLIDVELAFSREPAAPREYVQDRLRARADELADLLSDDNTYVYICGHKRMEEGVSRALTEICDTRGMKWPSLHEEMRNQGRYHVETYF